MHSMFRACALIALCGALFPQTSAAADHVVRMRDNRFSPRSITIQVGDRISWENVGDNTHTATANDNSFDTDDVDPGDTSAPVEFDTPGTIQYHCKHHKNEMTGTIVVTAAAAGTYGDTAPSKFRAKPLKLKERTRVPDLNEIYFNGDYGRHYLGPDGCGFIIANDFGHNHIAAKLKYAGETDQHWVYDIVGLEGVQHAYSKQAAQGQYEVLFRPDPSVTFSFWYYASKEDNLLDPPTLDCDGDD